MNKLNPKLEEIVSFFKDLKKKDISFFGVNDEYYIRHGRFSLHLPDMVETNIKTGHTTLRTGEYFTGYVAPLRNLHNMESLREFMLNALKPSPKKTDTEIHNPKIYMEGVPSTTIRDGTGRIHFSNPSIQVMDYGYIEYDVKGRTITESIFKKIDGKKEKLDERTIQPSQTLKIVFYPNKKLAEMAYQGDIDQNAYEFKDVIKDRSKATFSYHAGL